MINDQKSKSRNKQQIHAKIIKFKGFGEKKNLKFQRTQNEFSKT